MEIQETSIGLIGAGNMGAAVIRGAIKSNIIEPESIWVYDIVPGKLNQLQQEFGINIAPSIDILVNESRVIIPAVKPSDIAEVLAMVRESLTGDHLILSIAAGVTTEQLKNMVQGKCHVIRTMPNTPALVGEGMTAVCRDPSIPERFINMACMILKSFGKIEFVSEDQIHAVTAISGSSPAYAFMFLEALADGGVMMGLSREQSYRMAAQSLLGAAKLMLETGKHPGELKDMVCSPSGTTIDAVASLEHSGFRGIVTKAVQVCAEKSIAMGKEMQRT
ncbi:MAG: pyrroline-5-carboxylate reductase [Caldicoprobacterales bacterium]|jgi:pyrroline-5-carboxylate reductase|nr:pyrroline-5-carboxylate reductase [Clostridiales bacterium]